MVNVEWQVESPPVAADLVQEAATETLAQQDATGELTVVLSDDARLRDLNRQYLGMDAPTDVLSFPASESDPETGKTYLGDVVISVPRAEAQAKAAGHDLQSEIRLLVVHGVLHLLGHDHAEPGAKTRMWSAQAAVLRRLGLPDMVIGE